MKLKKKTVMIVSFALGTLIFATTALADITSKSGYDQLKDTLKLTAENCSDKLDSFTMDYSLVLKDNGKTLTSENEIRKYDRSKSAEENISFREGLVSGKYNTRSYSDPTTLIRKSDDEQAFSVTEFTEPRKVGAFNNPLKNNRAEDAEKIADAVVGSLRDQVMVKENTDGTKDFSGSLSEVQIPTLVNAVASFQLKQNLNSPNQETPNLTQDIFVKEVKGSAHINPEGLLENILGTVTILGKDKQGNPHEVTVEILVKLSGINSTVVTKPDLTGQKVNKQVAKTQNGPQQISNREKYLGKFSNDIILEKDGKFVKIGERIIEITQIDQNHVVGKYYEEYKPSSEVDAANKQAFSFDALFNSGEKMDPNGANFDVTNDAGAKTQGNIHFDENLGKIYLGYNRIQGNPFFDSMFSPDLE